MPGLTRNIYSRTHDKSCSVDIQQPFPSGAPSGSGRPVTAIGTRPKQAHRRPKSVQVSLYKEQNMNSLKVRRALQFGVVRQRPVSAKPKVSINESPMMLLPKARLRDNNDVKDFYDGIRNGSVIPMDTVSRLKLATIQASDSVWSESYISSQRQSQINNTFIPSTNHGRLAKRRVEFEGIVSGGSSSVDETPRSSSRPSSPESNSDSDQIEYLGESIHDSLLPVMSNRDPLGGHLDSYASETEMKKRFLGRRNTIANIPMTDRGAVVQERRISVELPRMRYLNGLESFIGWMISKFGDRKELQHLPRTNYVLRGSNPYFTNFVYKVPLHERVDSSDGLGLDDKREPPLESPSQSHPRGSFSGCSGAEGRPGSPTSCVSQGDVDQDEIDISVEFRNLIDVKITGVKNNSKFRQHRASSGAYTCRPVIGTTLTGNQNAGLNPSIKSESTGIPSPPPQAWHSNAGSLESLAPVPQKEPETVRPLTVHPKPSAPLKRKHSIIKKVKKPLDRPRPVKPPDPAPEVPSVPEVPVEETSATTESPASEPPSLPKVEAVVPELPKTKEQSKAERKQSRSRRTLMFNTNEPYINPDLLEKMDPEQRLKKHVDISISSDSDDTSKPTARVQPWIQGRLALSKQSSRFELPMDMKLLEDLSPQDYIRKYCVISSRRQYLYQKIFYKSKDKSGFVPLQDLEKGLREVLVGTLTKDKATEIFELLGVNEDTKIDYKLFSGMAALAERILYPEFVTGDTQDLPDFQRDKIECADFGALSWKLNGINISEAMQSLLKMIS